MGSDPNMIYKYRDYSPELMRWTNQDPMGENGGVNLYVFASNNAILYYDSLGLKKIEWLKNGYCCSPDTKTTFSEVATTFGLSEDRIRKLNEKIGNSIPAGNEIGGNKIWVVIFFDDSDLTLLSRLSYAEGDTTAEDKYAVPSVVINRRDFKPSGTFFKTISKIITEPRAFAAVSSTNKKWNESASPSTLETASQVKEWNMSALGAEKAYPSSPYSAIQGATFFHSNDKYPNTLMPDQYDPKSWNAKRTVKINKHYYFKITPKGK